MAIAHVCLSCGLDLARVRVQPEPLYGLPIARCPRCGNVAVRRRPPLERCWRQWRRLNPAIGRIALQALLIAALATVHMMTVRELQVARRTWLDPLNLVYVAGVMAVIGAWLTAGFAHWRAGAFATWTVFVAALLMCRPVLRPLISRAAGDTPTIDLERWGSELLVLGLTMILALAGIPIGLFLGRTARQWSRWRWRRLRAKMRTRRST